MNPRNPSLKPFIPWLKAERPIDWQQRFGREAVLEIEIGFGYVNPEGTPQHSPSKREQRLFTSGGCTSRL
jgi:hypothetical protein